MHIHCTSHFRYLTEGKHTIECFRKRTIPKLSSFIVDGLNSDIHLMQRDIKRGKLLIVFHDTNVCLISALALSDYREKNSEIPYNAAHMDIKKVKEQNYRSENAISAK